MLYFSFFIIIVIGISIFIYTNVLSEIASRNAERFKSVVTYVSESVRDANSLAAHVDEMRVELKLPYVFGGSDIKISEYGRGVIYANTTINGNTLHYYTYVGNVDELGTIKQEGDNVVLEK